MSLCRLGLDGDVPDHSTFSKNRHARFRASDLLRHLFETVVARCLAEGLWAAKLSRSTRALSSLVGDRRRPHIGRCFVRLARVLNDEAVGERDEPGRNFDAGDPIAEKIAIGTHRQRGIRGDPVRGQQVGVPGNGC
jgi:hypothetical protein